MPRVFEEYTGHFWGILETRDYMRARVTVINCLVDMKTAQALEPALELALGNLRLCRSDNIGTRSMIPAFMSRMGGQDQQAYDLIKWYQTSGQDSHYDWGDMSLPYLNLHDEDLFESIDLVTDDDGFGELSFYSALVLIKFRLLSDLRSLEASTVIGEKVPQEILHTIQENISSILARNQKLVQDVRDGKNIQPYIKAIEQQLDVLYARVERINGHLWPTLPFARLAMAEKPDTYSPGERSEVIMVLHIEYEAWDETPGAIEWVKKKLREQRR